MAASHFSVGRRIMLTRLMAVLAFCILGVSLTGWRHLAPIFELSLSLVGWVLIAVGVAGRIWCGVHICGNKTALIVVGPYSICRNPLYFSSFVGGLGVMFVTETLLFPLLFCVLFGAYYSKVILREEDTLRKSRGAAYETYCTKVPRFWPKFNLLSEPVTYTISTAELRRSLSEVVWFIIAGGIVEFLEGLHIAGYLPTYFNIY